jgi:hypothetical protein
MALQPHTFTCRYKYDPRKKAVGKTLQKDPRPTQNAEGDTTAPAAAGAAAAPAAAAPAGAAAAAATADVAPAKKPRFDAKKSYEALEQEVQALKATVATLQTSMSSVLSTCAPRGRRSGIEQLFTQSYGYNAYVISILYAQSVQSPHADRMQQTEFVCESRL